MEIKIEENWVKNYLIPKLIENKKLINDNNPNILINFKLRDISIKMLNTSEAFMLTKCYRVKIDYNYNEKEYSNTLIVKKTPKLPEDAYNTINFDALFHNEILAYTEILPILDVLKDKAEYFYSHRKPLSAVMVLGDFSSTGWRMTKAKVNLSLEHILLAVKMLGQFHGAGFALKQTNPEILQKIVSSLWETRYATEPDGEWKIICVKSPQRLKKSVKEHQFTKDPIPDEFLDKILKLSAYENGKIHVQPKEPLATLCHGDYLRNNIAFKYKENSEEPVDILMFDFQTLRYASPMTDLVTLLSLSAGKDVRLKNFENIFKTYRNELIKTYCEKSGTTVESLPEFLSYETLLKEYIRRLPHGLTIAACFLMNLFECNDYPLDDILNGVVRSEEEITEDLFTRGGQDVDVELSALVHELYEFTLKYDVDIFEGFL